MPVVNEAAMRRLRKVRKGAIVKQIASKLYAIPLIRKVAKRLLDSILKPGSGQPTRLRRVDMGENGVRFPPIPITEKDLRYLCKETISDFEKKRAAALLQKGGEKKKKPPQDVDRHIRQENEELREIFQGFHDRKPFFNSDIIKFSDLSGVEFFDPETGRTLTRTVPEREYGHLFAIINGKVTSLIDHETNRSTRMKYLALRILNRLGL
jgi:hypothetical protein